MSDNPKELLRKILGGVLNGAILFMLVLFALAGLEILASIVLFDETTLGIFIAAVLFCVIHNVFLKR